MGKLRRDIIFAVNRGSGTSSSANVNSGTSGTGNVSSGSVNIVRARRGSFSGHVNSDSRWHAHAHAHSTLPNTAMGGNSLNHLTSTNDAPQKKKWHSFITRALWTLVMISGFITAILAGHIYVMAIVTAIQIISFKEVIAIANVPSRARSLRFTKSLNWYFLGTTIYYLYGESIIYYFKHIVLVDRVLLPFATHHRFLSFMLYVFGFVLFVGSLQKGHYRFQFTQFAWTHMALYLIVVQAHFVLNNILEGLFWFLLPASLVIVNDIFAYICGMTFGRRPLIKLSPSKTVEGFVGAWVFTVLFGFLLGHIMLRYDYFTCPVHDLGSNFFTGLHCDANSVFTRVISFNLPSPWNSFSLLSINVHIFILSTFASLIAPFGGFFASGLKRTFKLKDFGASIPGHGGMTDRMDCQFIMGFFAHMYYASFISEYKTTVGAILELCINGLRVDQQRELMLTLCKHWVNIGVLRPEKLESVERALHDAGVS